MNNLNNIDFNYNFKNSAKIEDDVSIGQRVIFAGENIVIRSKVRIEDDSVIAGGVTIGQGAWVRGGSVVLFSIPANAIVDGKPAKVIGFVNEKVVNQPNDSSLISIKSFENVVRPAQISLNVGKSSLHLMRKIVDPRGSLSVGEVPSELPFSPARYFIVYNVPSVELRGEHAHRNCQQFLVCLHGSCRILLDDGYRRCEVFLDRPDMAVFMPEMIWGTQFCYSQDAVLLVFASRPYEVDDYIRTYDDFLLECNLSHFTK